MRRYPGCVRDGAVAGGFSPVGYGERDDYASYLRSQLRREPAGAGYHLGDLHGEYGALFESGAAAACGGFGSRLLEKYDKQSFQGKSRRKKAGAD